MRVTVDTSAIKETRWHQLLVRFVFGGLITAASGIIAKNYGPAIGGLFLAFPAIFPASATLIEKHERQRKQQAAMHGDVRARQAVALDGAGASMGSIGLIAFAVIFERLVGYHSPWLVLSAAALGWIIVSLLLWLLRKEW